MKVLASSEQCTSARRIRRSGAQLSELQMARSRATDALAPADLQGKKTVSLGGQMLDSPVAGQCGEMAGGVTRAPGRGRDVPAAEDEEKLPPGGSSGSRRLWRVLKAALPVQVALLLMYCVACLMEPHCCDLLNNFHASFGPQLSVRLGYCATEAHSWARGGASASAAAMTSLWNAQTGEAHALAAERAEAAAPARQLCAV
ncbi:hypothetical protein HPB47_000420 [Ixodes persulcatus]|uniref:Uncharacterized protein n=1 Tax=Ixodes persulcatus TaxID=34615 RepID=A0AC60PTP6_IXOPE|nr:hypothetical protein HPB47_000420 [Ixodes persulcatus]